MTPPTASANTSESGECDQPGALLEHGEQQGEPARVDALGPSAAAIGSVVVGDQRLHLDQQRTVALDGRHDRRAGDARRGGRRGTARSGRAPARGRRRSSRTARAPRSSRSGASRRAAGAGRDGARPRSTSTVSTTCSSTRGPASAALLRDVTDEHDGEARVAWPPARAGARTRGPGRRSPAPSRASGSCTVWMESIDHDVGAAPGRPARARAASSVSDASHSRGAQRAEPLGPQPHLLRATPRPTRTARRAPASADRRRDLGEQRRLADAGLAADQRDRPGNEPAAEHPVELATRRSACARRRPCRPRRSAAPGSNLDPSDDRPPAPATGSSTIVFHSPHPGHFPRPPRRRRPARPTPILHPLSRHVPIAPEGTTVLTHAAAALRSASAVTDGPTLALPGAAYVGAARGGRRRRSSVARGGGARAPADEDERARATRAMTPTSDADQRRDRVRVGARGLEHRRRRLRRAWAARRRRCRPGPCAFEVTSPGKLHGDAELERPCRGVRRRPSRSPGGRRPTACRRAAAASCAVG